MRFAFRSLGLCLLVLLVAGCGDTAPVDPAPKDNRVVPIDDPAEADADKTDKVEPKQDDPKQRDSKPNDPTQQPNDVGNGSTTPADTADKLNTAYIADDSFAAVVIHPKRILRSGLFPPLPEVLAREIFRGILEDVNPSSIEQMIVFAAPFTLDQLPGARARLDIDPAATTNPKEQAAQPEPNENAPSTEPKPKPDEGNSDPHKDSPPTDAAPEKKEPADSEASPDFSGLFEGLTKEPDKDPDLVEPRTNDPADVGGSSLGDHLGLVIRFADAESAHRLNARMISQGEHFERAGRPYYRASPASNQFVYFPDAQTAVIANRERLESLIDTNGQSTGPLIQLLAGLSTQHDIAAVALVEPVRDAARDILIDMTTDEDGQRLHGVPDATTPLDLVESIIATANFGTGDLLSVRVKAIPDSSIGDFKRQVDAIVGFGRWSATVALGDLEQIDFPHRDVTIRFADSLMENIELARTDDGVMLTLKRPDGFAAPAEELAAIGIEWAQDSLQRFYLRQCALAALLYHDTYRLFPDNGRFGIAPEPSSWRVDLLPNLEASHIHDRYHYSDPWDAERNLVLLDSMPRVFGSSGQKTTIMVFTGKDTPFPPEGPSSVADITDGLATTIFAVRAGGDKAVPWTQPADLVFDPENPIAALGAIPDQGFDVVFFDGRVATLPKDIDAATLRRLINPRDGEPVDLEALLNAKKLNAKKDD